DWSRFFDRGILKKPVVHVYITVNKLAKLRQLLSSVDGKTIIFCDSIDLGKRLSKILGVPFVYGETKNRLEIIKRNKLVILSRVGDEGIDVTDLKNVIEIDFLYGSRRQEIQRLGRLLHSRHGDCFHAILMTPKEYDRYSKRLLVLIEKGFDLKIIAE
ncbi:hypothetical protein DRJ19_04510, partial [Candidatus Woesearchaeota archaeon]